MPRFNLKRKHFFGFKYPKLCLLFIFIFVAYFLFSWYDIGAKLTGSGISLYLLLFLAGILFPFGFTAPFAVGIFLTVPIPNIWYASLLGGLGAVISDLLIFYVIRASLMDEFLELEHTHAFKSVKELIDSRFSAHLRNYLLYIFAGILIASPLPDEIAITMLAGLTSLKRTGFAFLGFLLHSLGVFLLLAANTYF